MTRTVYPKKYAHGFVVLCFVVVMQSFIMNSHEVFIHIHQGCFAGTGAIVRLPQCQWSKADGYGKISQCITTTKHSKAKTVCIFLGIYCSRFGLYLTFNTWTAENDFIKLALSMNKRQWMGAWSIKCTSIPLLSKLFIKFKYITRIIISHPFQVSNLLHHFDELPIWHWFILPQCIQIQHSNDLHVPNQRTNSSYYLRLFII